MAKQVTVEMKSMAGREFCQMRRWPVQLPWNQEGEKKDRNLRISSIQPSWWLLPRGQGFNEEGLHPETT